jgi:hypothetical protein
MRRGRTFLSVIAIVLAVGGAAVAGPTMAGSTKDANGNITCGGTGELANLGGIQAHANATTSQSEVEGCSEGVGGANNSKGRLVVRVNSNTTNPGARVSLDSDNDQDAGDGTRSICCSYINAQVGATGSGVWCGEDAPAGQAGIPGDGYSRPWGSPGDDGTAGNEAGDNPGPTECIPTQ